MTPPDDSQLAEILDGYLSQLQAGRRPGRAALLREHPELAAALKCMEALDGLVPPAEDDFAPVTMLYENVTPGGANSQNDPDVVPNHLPRDFGPYELLAEIGRGGMGVVYKARQKALDRIVAVKMILSTHLASPEHIRRFQVEAWAAARVRHPNITQIHDVGQHHGQHYFAMEHIEGESLAQRIARGPLPFDAAARLIATVARAVEHLHAHGIVHRDLKPSNILLDRDEQPYVTDFGLAKVFVPGSEATATGVIAGTPSYMAPEQASGRRAEIGPAADIYSLGAVLYELLTGGPPFRQESPLDTLLDIIAREPRYPRQVNPRVPRELELICLKCLAKSPADRYASAAALADDLERYIRQEPLAVRPPGLLQRAAQAARRRPALAYRLAVLGVFYVVELVNYHYGVSDWPFHWKMTVLAAAWVAVSIVCDWLVDRPRLALPARLIWGAFDSLFLLAALLFVAGGVTSGMIAVYPLLIAASALWLDLRFVGVMTAMSLVSYGILVADFYFWRTDLQKQFDASPTRHVLFAVSLVALAAIVSWLVQRLRTLSKFYGRQLP
jgi:tRNA A-37 threonylcarbamoyl transferase component Bud32